MQVELQNYYISVLLCLYIILLEQYGQIFLILYRRLLLLCILINPGDESYFIRKRYIRLDLIRLLEPLLNENDFVVRVISFVKLLNNN